MHRPIAEPSESLMGALGRVVPVQYLSNLDEDVNGLMLVSIGAASKALSFSTIWSRIPAI